jgi:hypothetical protein
MRILAGLVCILGMAGFWVSTANGAEEHDAIVITMKDGHRQKIPMADIAHIDFEGSTAKSVACGVPEFTPGMRHFVGKWEVGDGNGMKFFITLESNGQAQKSIGASHGTWTLVNGEAQIAWDDGWHDAIRKVGSKHEKFAFEPGKTFSDTPSNVTDAVNTQPEPI